jgi:hypothetical protein
MSGIAYLLVWIELGVARHVGIYSEDQPTMIGKPGFWHTVGQARGEGFAEARRQLLDSLTFWASYYRGPVGDAIRRMDGDNQTEIEWSDIIGHADATGRKAVVDYLVITDDVASMAVAVDHALNSSARAKNMTDSYKREADL